MDSEDNRALVLRFIDELINKQNPAAVDELVALDFIDHDAPAGQPPGPEGVKQTFAKVRGIFSELQAITEDVIAEGDRVVTRHTARARHTGEWLGIPATGKQVRWSTISIYRLAGGRVAERWGLMDRAAILEQLGGTGPEAEI